MYIFILEERKEKSGAGIIPICKKTGKILIQKRSKDIYYPNTWATFGGKSEEGETNEQTAIREFKEESGYKGHFTNLKKIYSHTKNKFTFHNYLALFKSEFTPSTINKVTDAGHIEVQDAKWVTLDELEDMKDLHYGLKALLKEKKNVIKNYIKKYCNEKNN